MSAQVLPKSRRHRRILRRQISDTKQIPYWGRKNICPKLYKIYSPGHFVPEFVHLWVKNIILFCKISGILVTGARVAVFSITTPCGLAEENPPKRCRNAEMYNSNVDWAPTPRAPSACYLHKHPSLAAQAVRVFWVVIFGELERNSD